MVSVGPSSAPAAASSFTSPAPVAPKMWPGSMNARPSRQPSSEAPEADAPEAGRGNADTDGGKRGRQHVGNAPGPQIDDRRGSHADGDDRGHERVRILHQR